MRDPKMNPALYRYLLTVLVLFAVCHVVGEAQAPTSETHDGLKRLLQRYPQADLNDDGVLTMDEARRFRMRLWQEETDMGVPVERERVESPIVPRHGEPYFAKTPYGALPGQVFDLWLPRNVAPPRPTVFYLAGDEETPVPAFIESTLNAGMAVCVIYGCDHGDQERPFEDVGLAMNYLAERNAAYGIHLADMGIFAARDLAEHALYAALTPNWGLREAPGNIRCIALLDAPSEETSDSEGLSYLEHQYPRLYASLTETPNLPVVALLNTRQHGGDLLQQALQHLGAETTLHNASSTEREIHLLRMATLFFEKQLTTEQPVAPEE